MEITAYSAIGMISLIVRIYIFMIIARAIISWVQPNPYNPIIQALYRLTEPILSPIRRALSRSIGNMGIDFSPIVAIAFLIVLVELLRWVLRY